MKPGKRTGKENTVLGSMQGRPTHFSTLIDDVKSFGNQEV